jgi:hypothetical protein
MQLGQVVRLPAWLDPCAFVLETVEHLSGFGRDGISAGPLTWIDTLERCDGTHTSRRGQQPCRFQPARRLRNVNSRPVGPSGGTPPLADG